MSYWHHLTLDMSYRYHLKLVMSYHTWHKYLS